MFPVVSMRPVYRLGLFLSGSFVLAGCVGRLNVRPIEDQIKADIERQGRRVALASVRCPKDVTRQAGAYFRCVGELKTEGQFTINVVQQDNQGTVEWDIPNSPVLLNLVKVETKLQEDFAKQFSRRPRVDCGEVYRINQPGELFECRVVGGVTVGQEQVNTIVVKIDPEGNLNWYEVREAIAPLATTASAPTTAATPGATPTQDGAAPTPQSSGASAAPKEKVAGTRQIERPRVPNDSD
jgi:hypothetical protein